MLMNPALPRHLAVREKALGRNDIGPRRTAPPVQRPSAFPCSTTEIAPDRAHAAVAVLNTRNRPPATRLLRRLSVPGRRRLAWPDILVVNTSGGNKSKYTQDSKEGKSGVKARVRKGLGGMKRHDTDM